MPIVVTFGKYKYDDTPAENGGRCELGHGGQGRVYKGVHIEVGHNNSQLTNSAPFRPGFQLP